MSQYEPPSERSGLAPRRRPVTVTLAVALTLVGAVLGAVNGILLISLASTVAQDFRVNAAGSGATRSEIDDLANVFQGSMIVSGIIILVLAVVVALLAFATARGSNAARITLVVLLAASVCVGLGTGTFTSAARNATNVSTQNIDSQTAENLGQALADAIPAWFAGLAVGLSCLEILAVLAVIVLLLVPASNDYFRRGPAAAGVPGPGAAGQPPGPGGYAPPSGPAGYAPPSTQPPPSAQPPSAQPPPAPPPPEDRPGGSTL